MGVITTQFYVDSNEEIIDEVDGEDQRIKFCLDKANWDLFEREATTTTWENCIDIDINSYRNNIVTKITEISKNNIPFKESNRVNSGNPKKYKSVPWWDLELKELKNNRDATFKMMTEEFRNIEKEKLRNEYKKHRNNFSNLIKKKKKEFKVEKIESTTKQSTDTHIWGFVRAYEGQSGKGNKIAPITNKNYKIILNKVEKANILGEHYEFISSDNNYSEKFKSIKKQHYDGNQTLFEKKTM